MRNRFLRGQAGKWIAATLGALLFTSGVQPGPSCSWLQRYLRRMKTASATTGTFSCSEGAAVRCSVYRVKADFAAQRIHFSSLQYVTVKPIERKTLPSGEVLTIELDNYVLLSPDVLNLEPAARERLQAVVGRDPLALVEYWSMDPDYDGELFRSVWQDFRRKGEHMDHLVGFGAQQDDGERQRRSFVLLGQLLVHSQEHVKFARVSHEAEEFAVADASPTGLRNSLNGMAGKFLRQVLGQAFVEEDAHSGRGEQAFAGLFQKGNGLLARDRGVLFQKVVERIAALEVIQQRPHGNARAGKARLAAHDFRVGYHNGSLRHACN